MKLSLFIIAFVAGTLIGIGITLHITGVHNDNTMHPIKGFNRDYQIDLKQDGYIIIDERGAQHRIGFRDLENFFMRDNL